MTPAFASSFRLGLLCLVVLAGFSGIGVRLYHLQVLEREPLALIAESNRKQVIVHEAKRGGIVDRRGNLLATNRTYVELGVDPQVIRDEDRDKWPELAALIDVPLEELEHRMRTRTAAGESDYAEDVRLVRWRRLHRGLDEPTYEQVRELGIRGVYGNRTYRRVYPSGELAAHIVGYANREGRGTIGVEHAMDFYLRGEDGWMESERDGRRRELMQFRTREVPATDGLNIELTLDSMVQHVIEEELGRIVDEFSPKGATIIVSEPDTGHLLGLGNYPTFDLNHYNVADIAHQRNLAVTDVLEPGSTFKIVPVAAAFNENLIEEDQVFDAGVSVVKYRGRRVSLPRDHREMGEVTVEEIVRQSSNRGVAYMGLLLGERRLYDYSRAFGFGERTGFPLIGERSGTLHSVGNWDGLTITRLPMGHALSATPLQIHYAMGALANEGMLMEPRIIRRAFNERDETVFEFTPQARRRAVSERTAERVSRLLVRAVAPGGTAPQGEIPGYEVAGKTGTTQKIVDGRYSRQHHVASFSGYFPASNPKVVITVIVDEPTSAGPSYGGVVAAPSFRRIGVELIPYLGIEPTRPGRELAHRGGGGL